MALYGLALGSSESPKDWNTADHPDGLSLDRHELAHAVLHQMQPPDSDAPTLLIEGRAEAHSGMTSKKRAKFAAYSRLLWQFRTGAGPEQSYLSELTGPDWYRRVNAPVYSVGGALAEFLWQKHGVERFLNLYFACRPGQFASAVRTHLGVELEQLEAEFWTEVERLTKTDQQKK